MKRKTVVKAHVIRSAVAVITISAFFTLSLIAELSGDVEYIKQVKKMILYSLPLLLIAMPILALTGKKLAGKSQNPIVLAKQSRMKIIAINGMVLIGLAIFLYFRSHYKAVDEVFLAAQIAEFGFGLTNLTLIGMNIRSGFKLSGSFKKSKPETERLIRSTRNVSLDKN